MGGAAAMSLLPRGGRCGTGTAVLSARRLLLGPRARVRGRRSAGGSLLRSI